MFHFLRRSNSKKTKQTRFEKILTRLFSQPPMLDLEARENVKKRILNRITAQCEESKNADILDRKLAGKEVQNSTGVVDFLASIAEALLNLPKTIPKVTWREGARGHFKRRSFFSFFSVLKQATAVAMLTIVVGGIALTSFVSQTQTAVAQLSVSSGIVRIRVADSPFFEEVRRVATIRLGDTIRVEEDSGADLTFFDDSEMRLAENSEVAITEFSPDFLTREKSAVKVAVLAGSVETTVAKESGSFEVETPTSSVEAQNAKFSVAVNPDTGSTKIEASEDMVAVKSNNNPESVALIAGEAVVFADEASAALISRSTEALAELPTIEEIATDIDFIKIRNFDALIAAQKDDITVARKIRSGIEERLDLLLLAIGIEEIEGGELEAIEIFIRKNYLAGPKRDTAMVNLARAEQVGNILNYYFVAPQFLAGVPEFEILADSRYTPSGQLRNLFAILRAKQLAHTEIHATIDELAVQLTIELAENLRRQNLSDQLAQILDRMEDQPVFLSVLEKLAPMIPSENRASVYREIRAMKKAIRFYVGS
jgi:hypothetical protein